MLKQRGFSLVEMSISLAIIGVIAASAISVAVSRDFSVKKSETENRLDRIEEALAGYLIMNKRLPCPADGRLLVTEEDFGLEVVSTGAAHDTCDANFNDGNVHSGVLPVATLQLPDEFMFDAWGNRITYVVDNRFTNSPATNQDCNGEDSTHCFIDTAAGGITVNDASGTARTTEAIYVLISHGENGHGAFIGNGNATQAQVDGGSAVSVRINALGGGPFADNSAAEVQNASFDSDGDPVAFNNIFVMKNYVRQDDLSSGTREYFDDILRYRTKEVAVRATGASLYDGICRDAFEIMETPEGGNACSGAAEISQCEIFAVEVSMRCLQ